METSLNLSIRTKSYKNKIVFDCCAFTNEYPIITIEFTLENIVLLDNNEFIKSKVKKYINTDTKKYIFIREVYNNFQQEYRGFGKKYLKECLNYCVDNYKVDIDNTPIILFSGGRLFYRKFVNRKAELSKYSKSELLELFRKYDLVNKKDFQDYLTEAHLDSKNLHSYSRDVLVEKLLTPIIEYEENIELSEYYSRNFNLKVLDYSNIYNILMACYLKDFLN